MSTNDAPSVASILQQQPEAGQSTSLHASGFDNLTCQWQGCGERCTSAEALYEHVCERHVGRKSTNNLNLQCQWGSCRTTTVKRDHITSHIRVHVPLKPHQCGSCGKSFKRPQDLKKHVKTHADDSVLNRPSEGPGMDGQRPMPGYGQGGPRDASMYGGPPHHQSVYGYPPSTNAPAQVSNGGGYGPVYYNMPQNVGYNGLGLTEQRKRQHDSLDAFFGDVKRRNLDPTQYIDLGDTFNGLQGMPMFNNGGYGGNGYSSGFQHQQNHHNGFGGGGGGGPQTATMTVPPAHNFDVNFNNLKTKNDLMSIDHFLEQLQKTVYEHSTHVVAPRAEAGLGPDGHPWQQPTGMVDPSLDAVNRRPSPPSSYSTASSEHPGDFTPGSQISSHSPASTHSHHSHINAGYPSLPPAGSMGQQQMGGYMQHQAGVPPTGLGDPYEDHDRTRRHSGGYLQRAKPGSPKSPHVEVEQSQAGKGSLDKEVGGMQSPDQKPPSTMEPPARPGQAEGGSEGSAQDERLEGWVQNMRTIEALRKFVHQRLQQGDFDAGSPTSSSGKSQGDRDVTPKAEPQSRDYPMEDVKAVAYPSLPKAAQAS